MHFFLFLPGTGSVVETPNSARFLRHFRTFAYDFPARGGKWEAKRKNKILSYRSLTDLDSAFYAPVHRNSSNINGGKRRAHFPTKLEVENILNVKKAPDHRKMCVKGPLFALKVRNDLNLPMWMCKGFKIESFLDSGWKICWDLILPLLWNLNNIDVLRFVFFGLSNQLNFPWINVYLHW